MAAGMGYTVTVTAGAHTWTVTNDSPPVYGLADPLVIGWRQAPSPRPGQPEAMVCQFAVSTPDVANLADVVVGTPVEVTVSFTWDGFGEGFPVRFSGVVAAGDAVNVDRDPPAMIVTYTCVDRTGDLLEAVTDTEDVAAVLSLEAAMRAVYDGAFGAGSFNAQVVRPAGFPSPTTRVIYQRDGQLVWDAWLELLDSYAYDTRNMGLTSDQPYARLIMDPYPPALSPLRWELSPVPEAFTPRDGVGLPFTVTHPGTLYCVTVKDPDPEAGVLDACYVDFDASWSLTKPRVTNKALVRFVQGTGVVDGVTGEVDPGKPRSVLRDEAAGKPAVMETRDTVLYQIPADGTSYAMAQTVAQLMIPPSADTNGWAPEAFRWNLYRDPAGCRSFPLLFPDQTAPSRHKDRTDAYVRPIAVAGIPAGLNPANPSDAVVGQLGSVTLTIDDGGAIVDVILHPGTPAAGEYVPGDSIRWDAVDPGLTWNTVPPTQTWNDYLAVSHWTWNDWTDYWPEATWDQLCPADTWNAYGLAGP